MTAKSRRAVFLSLLTLIALSITAIACESSENGSPPPDETLSVFITNPIDLGVGQTRLPMFVFLSDETRVNDRLADMEFSYRQGEEDLFEPIDDVTWREWPVSAGAYVVNVDFESAGVWEFKVKLREGDHEKEGSAFAQVKESSSAPNIGDEAPSVETKTASTVEEISQISSAMEPDLDFYSISLDDALASGKPTVVLFSTPGYCQSATCGPQMDALAAVKDRYPDVNYIHVEIWDNIAEMRETGDQSIGEVAEPVSEWGLLSEPWTFFIDSDGIIRDRFEQFATTAELEEAMERLLTES